MHLMGLVQNQFQCSPLSHLSLEGTVGCVCVIHACFFDCTHAVGYLLSNLGKGDGDVGGYEPWGMLPARHRCAAGKG